MWTPAASPPDEDERIAALAAYDILDTEPEEAFDRVVRLAAAVYDADLAYVAFLDGTHQWIKAAIGTMPQVLPRKRSICNAIVSTGEPLIIGDLQTDPRMAGHPILGHVDHRFYAGAPLKTPEGHVLGTVCVLRRDPAPPATFSLSPLLDLAAIVIDELELRQRIKTLTDLAERDGLTGVANRRAFDAALDRASRRAVRMDSELSLLMIDLDWFKLLNDTSGHLAGDDALRAAAATLSGTVRRPYDLVARYGGEEFAVILPDTGMVGARHVAGTIQAVLRLAAIPHPASPYQRLTASIGAATATGAEARPEFLIAEADAALYAAKRGGRNRIVVGQGRFTFSSSTPCKGRGIAPPATAVHQSGETTTAGHRAHS